MADLRELVRHVHATPGVRGALAVGRDGLLIDAAGLDATRAEHVAALIPGLTRAAEQVGAAAQTAAPQTLVVEHARELLAVLPLGPEVTVVALVDADPAGGQDAAGQAVYALRRGRAMLAALAGVAP